ncbi:MAG: hypothetical protein M4579_003737 [Chaenotheca gracillima]|nr:MAG: hypothetical protein M4579_003737 [Chaenotheca gracillima]
MTLEDFEKSLKEDKSSKESHHRSREERDESGRKHRHHHHHHHHHRSSHQDEPQRSRKRSHGDRHKRVRDSADETGDAQDRRKRRHTESPTKDVPQELGDADEEEWVERKPEPSEPTANKHNTLRAGNDPDLKRDSWMEGPSAVDIDYVQRNAQKSKEGRGERFLHSKAEQSNQLEAEPVDGSGHAEKREPGLAEEPTPHEVDYIFGDMGSKWRMTKLKAVYNQVKETGRSEEDIAIERFGDLQSFDDAREEEIELDRRDTYGKGYVGKERPSGDLYEERKLDMGIRRDERHRKTQEDRYGLPEQGTVMAEEPAATQTVPLDQTALNRLKAQMMKAKLQRSSDLPRLEAEYNSAVSSFANRKESDVVVLGAMDNRMLAGGRGEVKAVNTTRGRERGLVEQNEDMNIEDMLREERRTKGQAGGEGQRFAERIAKDAKFDNDLEYMDDNATKLAKRVQKSEINLKNTAIGDFQKMNRILDSCPLCHHEDTNKPPVAPVVSLGTRSFLTLPTEPEISDGGAMIIPTQHRGNLLECDDDEWEEIRASPPLENSKNNFMKCLTRMYHDQGRDVIFYENAASPERKKHAALQAVPLPYSLGEVAPAFFKEAILTADEEWTQHKKIIDTLARARDGQGKLAFRRSLVKEMPYFHVWFELDGGLGHIVEDSNRWPKGDLFAREIIGGMLDVDPTVVRRQGRWAKGSDPRTEDFKKRWRKFDWTRVLTDS